ncbi:MAG: hypothetical protein IPM56_17390 [Ignavibacteriales bacterium]|nr:MAG: hypothetical protein IPM56_17390 [Ignavibacteriales bacterium]
MKTGFIFLIALSFLFVISCEYSPTETYFKEIVIPEPDIDLQILNEDELNFLRGRVFVQFSSVLNGRNIIRIKTYLNNSLINNFYDTTGTVEINTTSHPDGPYELTFQLFTTTGTGSLADLAGAEVFILTKKYNVQFYNAPVITPQITEMILSGSDLHVKWNRYNGSGFQKYVLLYNDVVLKEISDQDSVEIIDPAYVGGTTTRTIKTYVANRPFESSIKSFSSPQINFISATIQNQNSVLLTWERNNFDNAFGEYRINRNINDGQFIAQISDINTTTFTDNNPVFGGDATYGIEAVPYHLVNTYPHPATVTVPSIGQEFIFPTGMYIDHIPATDLYYTFYDRRLRVYDNSFNMVNSAEYNLTNPVNNYKLSITNSSNGELFYIIHNSPSTEIIKINSSTLQVEQTYNLNTIAGLNIGTLRRISISDNNRLAVVAVTSSSNPTLYIFDMNNLTLLASRVLAFNSYSDYAIISPDGNYIRVESNLLSLNGSSLTLIGNVEKYSVFTQGSESLVQLTAAHQTNTLQLLNCANLSVLKEVPITQYLFGADLSYDKATGLVGCHSPSVYAYYIIDINNQVIKKKVPVLNYHVSFKNMTLFSNDLRLNITF